MIKIENAHTYKGDGFKVGRPSPLGNPFKITLKDTRTKVIAQYREWLLKKLETSNPTSKAFMALVHHYRKEGELVLICWCKPSACHADVIKEFIEETVKVMGWSRET